MVKDAGFGCVMLPGRERWKGTGYQQLRGKGTYFPSIGSVFENLMGHTRHVLHCMSTRPSALWDLEASMLVS